MKIYLELSLINYPSNILEVGEVTSIPSIGDFVDRKESGWKGYVKGRRWNIRSDGSGIDVRIWLQDGYNPE